MFGVMVLDVNHLKDANDKHGHEVGNIPVIIAKGFALYDASRDAKFVDVFNRADEAMYENKREIKGLK